MNEILLKIEKKNVAPTPDVLKFNTKTQYRLLKQMIRKYTAGSFFNDPSCQHCANR